MITSIIKDYLLTNKTVIIPQIGTLTITNDDTLEIMFLSYLKFDDKKLTETHARITGNSIVESKMIVYDWVEQFIKDLDNGQQRVIGDLGFFFKNSSGEYEFNANILEMESSQTTPVAVVEETPLIIEEVQLAVIEEEPVEETPTEIIEDEITPEPAQEIEGVETEQPEKIETPKAKAPKKKTKLTMIIGILLVLSLSSISIILLKDKLFKTDEKTEVVEDEEQIEEISSEEVTPSEPETLTEQEVEIPEPQQNSDFIEPKSEKNEIVNKNYLTKTMTEDYYVIVGAFENENNATRLLNNLLSKGYEAEMIDEYGFRMVSIARFHTREEAEMKRKEVMNAWIFKK